MRGTQKQAQKEKEKINGFPEYFFRGRLKKEGKMTGVETCSITPEIKESYRKFAEEITGWQVKDTSIKKIKVHSFSGRVKKQIDSNIIVGEELDSNLSNIPHESVLAIFESDKYLVVTPNKYSPKGTVYLFEPSEVLSIEREHN